MSPDVIHIGPPRFANRDRARKHKIANFSSFFKRGFLILRILSNETHRFSLATGMHMKRAVQRGFGRGAS